MTPQRDTRSMLPFLTIWFGQILSVFGSGLTAFALGVWVYQRTQSATLFALIALSNALPGILIAPLVGALVDRWDRRQVMILCNLGFLVTPVLIALLLWTNQLQLWHIYTLVALTSVLVAFHQPAFQAATSLLVPRAQYGRANGLVQLGLAVARILSPIVASLLITSVQIWSTMLIDAASYVVAIISLLLVAVPRPPVSEAGRAAPGQLAGEASYGWHFIRARPGLLILLIFFAITNFALGMVQTLITPLVLGFADATALGRVLAASGAGMVAGGLAMSVWGGPRRRVPLILGLTLLQGVVLLLGGLRPSLELIGLAAFVFMLSMIVIISSSQVIWQLKVPPDVQGRVFAIRSMIAWSSLPLAYAAAGPLADYVFNPLLLPGGPLADSLGVLIGVGPGRGIAVLFLVLGVLLIIAAIGGALAPRLRHLERELPDAAPATPPAAPQATPSAVPPSTVHQVSESKAMSEHDQQAPIYKVVVNDAQQYAVWPLEQAATAGWRDSGTTGSQEHCEAYIKQATAGVPSSPAPATASAATPTPATASAATPAPAAASATTPAPATASAATPVPSRVPVSATTPAPSGSAAPTPEPASGGMTARPSAAGGTLAITTAGGSGSLPIAIPAPRAASGTRVPTPPRAQTLLTPAQLSGPLTLLLLLALALLVIAALAPPAPLPASAPTDLFSAARARSRLEPMIQTPRPLGSAESIRVRDYLVAQLRELGLQPQIQHDPPLASTSPQASAILLHSPNNIMARIPGSASTKALLLMAHYDSVSTGISANDGAASVAMLLETVRALQTGPQLRNDVIILLTDGEELHLLGSHAFLDSHPWAQDVGLILNFVARGTGGPSLMFETSPGNGWLINEFARVAPHPIANSLTYEVYRDLLPNDTDFTPFKAAGYSGLNFAYLEGLERYHTMGDDLAHVNEAGIQHQGEQALAFTRHFGALDLTNTRTGDAIYFDLAATVLVHYPAVLALPLALLTAVLFGAVVVLGLRRQRLTGAGIGLGLLAFIGSLAAGSAAVGLLWWAVRQIISGYRAMPWGATYNTGFYMIGLIALCVTVIAAIYVGLRSRLRSADLAIGALLGLLLLLLAGSLLRPGTSYVLTWPLIGSLLALGYTFRQPADAAPSWKPIAALLLGALPGMVLMVPIIYLTYQAISLPLSWAVALLVGLLLATLVPHMQLMAQPFRWLLPGLGLLICLICLIGGALTAGFDAGHPKPNSLFYVMDADRQTALWATTDAGADAWTEQYLSGPLTPDDLSGYFPSTERTFLTTQAPVAPIATPAVTLLDSAVNGDTQTAKLHIRSQRAANVLVTYLMVEPGTKVRVAGNGRFIQSVPRGNLVIIGYVAPPAEGFDLDIQLQPAQPIKLQLTDIAYHLPIFPDSAYPPRPDWMVPTPFFEIYQNMSFVNKRYSFEPGG